MRGGVAAARIVFPDRLRRHLLPAGEGVSATFADIEALAAQCRFHDCRHYSEPGCAILEALDTGALDAARWRAYGKLQRELEFQNGKEDPRAKAESRKVWIRRNKMHRAEMKFRKRLECGGGPDGQFPTHPVG